MRAILVALPENDNGRRPDGVHRGERPLQTPSDHRMKAPTSRLASSPAGPLVAGTLWIVLYLGVVLAPLVVLFVGPMPPPGSVRHELGIALGFAGLTMMATQFLLTARFKRVALPYGIDVVYYFHRYLAVVALALVLAHPLLLVGADRAMLALLDPRTAPWWMTAGVASLVGLVALVVTSLFRRRLGIEYDVWRMAHAILATAAVGLALAHVHGVGRYVGPPAQRALWAAIGAVVLGLVAWVRLVRPWRLARRPYRVESVRPERGDAWTVTLVPDGHPGFGFAAGQFAWVTFRLSPFVMREHPFSISSSPSPSGRLELTVKALGDFTRTIGTLAPGEVAYVDGPYGAFTLPADETTGLCLIGGGIGLAPVVSMLRALADRGSRRPILLVAATSTWERATFRDAIEAVAARLPTLRVVSVVEEPPAGWTGEVGRVDAALLDRHLPPERRELHAELFDLV
jgi:predicted ferric reductase